MMLLLKHFTGKKELHVSSLIIISMLFFIAVYLNHKLVYFTVLIDIYFYLLLTQFQIISDSSCKKTKSEINMEIIAEGTRKAKTDNLADTITEYARKFNT